MKLESPSIDQYNKKRKMDAEEVGRIYKRFMSNQHLVGADVIQDNLQKEFFSTGIATLSTNHCKRYPISGVLVDGICPRAPVTRLVTLPSLYSTSTTQLKKEPCSRCLSGESGHWKHAQ
ncbi:hypothetical protein FHG87_000834 [Trinorchestia longiramus]|nr:hypothetical protein FHG87_000834 [Trinorchestia longiramus]